MKFKSFLKKLNKMRALFAIAVLLLANMHNLLAIAPLKAPTIKMPTTFKTTKFTGSFKAPKMQVYKFSKTKGFLKSQGIKTKGMSWKDMQSQYKGLKQAQPEALSKFKTDFRAGFGEQWRAFKQTPGFQTFAPPKGPKTTTPTPFDEPAGQAGVAPGAVKEPGFFERHQAAIIGIGTIGGVAASVLGGVIPAVIMQKQGEQQMEQMKQQTEEQSVMMEEQGTVQMWLQSCQGALSSAQMAGAPAIFTCDAKKQKAVHTETGKEYTIEEATALLNTIARDVAQCNQIMAQSPVPIVCDPKTGLVSIMGQSISATQAQQMLTLMATQGLDPQTALQMAAQGGAPGMMPPAGPGMMGPPPGQPTGYEQYYGTQTMPAGPPPGAGPYGPQQMAPQGYGGGNWW